jgi:predicted ATP-dependent Lon-type protease
MQSAMLRETGASRYRHRQSISMQTIASGLLAVVFTGKGMEIQQLRKIDLFLLAIRARPHTHSSTEDQE